MRDNGIKKAGISQWRYRELKAFCMQYDEKKHEAQQLLGLHAHQLEDTSGRKDAMNKAALTATRCEQLLRECEIIEQAAHEAEPGSRDAIIKNVTQGIRFEESCYYGERTSFYRARERFFIILDRALREQTHDE